MKTALTIFFGLFWISGANGQDLSKLYEKVNSSVVTITVEEKEIVTDRKTMSKAVVTNEGLGS